MKKQPIAALALAATLTAGAADDPKSRVDAFLAKEFKDGALRCMSCAYEQHGETRYRFVAQKGWENFDENTPLHVASITKVFTATLLMQLSEEGKISLNDSVKKYVPEFPGENVPILNLMTHTAGWRNRTGHVAKTVDEKRHDEFYATMYQDFEVNEKFRYMSQGYDIREVRPAPARRPPHAQGRHPHAAGRRRALPPLPQARVQPHRWRPSATPAPRAASS